MPKSHAERQRLYRARNRAKRLQQALVATFDDFRSLYLERSREIENHFSSESQVLLDKAYHHSETMMRMFVSSARMEELD